MINRSFSYRRICVWELPVRIYHWLNAACILALVATGLIIGNPTSIGSATEAYQQYQAAMGRPVHAATKLPTLECIPYCLGGLRAGGPRG